MNKIARFTAASAGSVEVVSRLEAMQCTHWANAFASEAQDRRYYELIEDTIHKEFDYRYFAVRDWKGEICAIQPFFILDQDLLVGTKPLIGRLTDFIRRFWPRFMRTRTLMVGCAAGEGHLDGQDEFTQRSSARLLASAIVKKARDLKARLIVLKEFPAKYRATLECFVDNDFTRMPSLPNVMLNIDYSSFEDYMMRALSSGARRKLRLKLRAGDQAASPIEMSVVDDVAPIIDEIYPLYLQVYNRSNLHFEKLTKEYFCGLGHRMGDKNRFFIWRQNGKIVAFGSCILQGDTIHAEYLGLDYTVALDLHLYHYTFRDLISWGIANGYKRFHSTALNYDPKLHLQYRLDPIDLYVRHTSTICNAVFRRILPWLEPTRYDDTLKKFANYDELWAPTGREARTWAATASAALSQAKQTIVSIFVRLRDKASSAANRVFGTASLRWRRLGASLELVAIATAILLALDLSFDIPHITYAYLLPILLVAIKSGRGPALIAAAASALCAAMFIYEPKLSLYIDDSQDMLELACFGAAAFMISQIFGRRPSHDLIH
ncbi:MAG: GNAT family N-acetyltransferase [Pseudolabrys sp.]